MTPIIRCCGKSRSIIPAGPSSSSYCAKTERHVVIRSADFRYWDGPAVHSGLNCWTEAGRREERLKEHAMRTSQKAAGIIATSKRLHRNMLAIALANKLARIAWAVLARGRAYQPRITADA